MALAGGLPWCPSPGALALSAVHGHPTVLGEACGTQALSSLREKAGARRAVRGTPSSEPNAGRGASGFVYSAENTARVTGRAQGKVAVGCIPRPRVSDEDCAGPGPEPSRSGRTVCGGTGVTAGPQGLGRSQCGQAGLPTSLSSASAKTRLLPSLAPGGPWPVPAAPQLEGPLPGWPGGPACGGPGCSHAVHSGLGGDQGGGRGWPGLPVNWASRTRHSVCLCSAVSPERKEPEKQSADWPAASARPQWVGAVGVLALPWVHRLLPGPGLCDVHLPCPRLPHQALPLQRDLPCARLASRRPPATSLKPRRSP